MPSYTIKKTSLKGKGLFAKQNIQKGDLIVHQDLSRLKTFSAKELADNPRLHSTHVDYVGRGRYVIDYSPLSYMNHSCDPNCFVRFKTISKMDAFALRDIKKGEEIACDYATTAIDQMDKQITPPVRWVMECRCKSRHCRKRITGDFFRLPIHLQKRYFRNLPPWIRKKYKTFSAKGGEG